MLRGKDDIAAVSSNCKGTGDFKFGWKKVFPFLAIWSKHVTKLTMSAIVPQGKKFVN